MVKTFCVAAAVGSLPVQVRDTAVAIRSKRDAGAVRRPHRPDVNSGMRRDPRLRVARKIEDVIMWQPGKEQDAVLDGTPDDPRFKYIKYD